MKTMEKIIKLLAEVREMTGDREQYELADEEFDECFKRLEKSQELYQTEFSRMVKKETGWEI